MTLPSARPGAAARPATAAAAPNVPARSMTAAAASSAPAGEESVIDIDSTRSTPVLSPRITKKAVPTRKRAKNKGEELLLEMSNSMTALKDTLELTQREQSWLFKIQHAHHEQQILASKAELTAHEQQRERNEAMLFLKYEDSQLAHQDAMFQRMQEERRVQIHETEVMSRWSQAGTMDDHMKQMAERIRAIHTAIPYNLLAIEGVSRLRSTSTLQVPAALRHLIQNDDAASSIDSRPESPVPPPPLPHAGISTVPQTIGTDDPQSTSALEPPAPVLTVSTSAETQAEAGPGPRTQANMLAAAGITDI
ncbi:hypothetical protein FS749_013598 [Ceratobasidium sp. UAMH 11750]|nr:hypothetical protein FS749_013598 [Ceratobasidium sp. UAMH 11750]